MTDIQFLASDHNLWLVAASFVIATLASYVTLELSRRVRSSIGEVNPAWLLAGSLTMGTGIWSMHFVGMLAFSLPIRIGFAGALTLLSWIAAVAASATALRVASLADYKARSVLMGSLVMGAGICCMHYVGMAALDMTPGIVWDLRVVSASVAVAITASAAALVILRLLLRVASERRLPIKLLGALAMGAAICGMHYTGMAAASFPAGSVCLSADALGGAELGAIVVVASCMLLLVAWFVSILEARLQVVARQLLQSLQAANTPNEERLNPATSDALTDLPNRLLFEDRLRHAMLRGERTDRSASQQHIAVLFVDLDGFKPVNDSFGHAAGDMILKAAAQRLTEAARSGDTVARAGGDEFLILLEGLKDAQDCVVVLDRILAALQRPFEVMGRNLQISCSIGVAMHTDKLEPYELVERAGAAMDAAKRAGGGAYAMFETNMATDTADQIQLQADLRHALEGRQIELYYQPKINARRHRMTGVEALARWNHPRLGLLGPDRFIGLAERHGLMVGLGGWILNEACAQVAAWGAAGVYLRVSINLSAVQLRDPTLADKVEEALRRHDILGSQLLCEITESVAMMNTQVTQSTFEQLARLGVFLSIDDFGTGYSSLHQLSALSAHQLKIDHSFIQDLETKEGARFIVEAMIKLAHSLGLTLVAEGVETVGQRDILLRLGCDELQGFFYARPMRASSIAGWSVEESATPAPGNGQPPIRQRHPILGTGAT